jgi:ATP-dependent Lon protease
MTTAKPRPPLAPGETRAYPVLPLRDIVVFPHMIAPLFVGRKKPILALEEAMRSDTFILLATQKNAPDDDPATEAIYEVGTLASVVPTANLKRLTAGANRLILAADERSLQVDLVRLDRNIPAAGCVASRDPCPSTSTQRAAAQIPKAVGVR